MPRPAFLLLFRVCSPRGRIFTELLPSKNRGVRTQTQYEARRSHGLGCHDAHTTFHEDRFKYKYLKVDREEHTVSIMNAKANFISSNLGKQAKHQVNNKLIN
jgi:hypothetical protein